MGGWGRPNDYVTSKIGLVYQCCLITGYVVGVQTGQNIDYIIYGMMVPDESFTHTQKVQLDNRTALVCE